MSYTGEEIPQLGSQVSIISKLLIRYTGCLCGIDPIAYLIALTGVRCHGTEDRLAPNRMEPQSIICDLVVFLGTEIMEIHVINDNFLLHHSIFFLQALRLKMYLSYLPMCTENLPVATVPDTAQPVQVIDNVEDYSDADTDALESSSSNDSIIEMNTNLHAGVLQAYDSITQVDAPKKSRLKPHNGLCLSNSYYDYLLNQNPVWSLCCQKTKLNKLLINCGGGDNYVKPTNTKNDGDIKETNDETKPSPIVTIYNNTNFEGKENSPVDENKNVLKNTDTNLNDKSSKSKIKAKKNENTVYKFSYANVVKNHTVEAVTQEPLGDKMLFLPMKKKEKTKALTPTPQMLSTTKSSKTKKFRETV